MKIKHILVIFFSVCMAGNVLAFDHSHSGWNSLLEKNVVMLNENQASKVNYSDFKKDVAMLDNYLSGLSSVSLINYKLWEKDQKLAFLINAYNAFTIKLILEHYPVKSIKDIGSFLKSPWKIKFIPLLGRTVSLDDLEHGLIREEGVFDEPRIHVALVCASIGCPALKNTAFRSDTLEDLLESGLVNFLSDKSRNRFNNKKEIFQVSKIFKWYGGDFNKKYGSVYGLLKKYNQYLVDNDSERLIIKHKKVKIEFLDYDWNLNDI